MIKTAINKLTEYQNLTQEETKNIFNQIMEGNTTNAQIAAFLIALKMKKETIAEITGAVEVMREKATRIVVEREILVDTCGTGGDNTDTFNISTSAAFIVGGIGIAVAKHGNKGVSSKCGSADVLCALGVNINADASKTKESIEKANIGFAFAPIFHKVMKHVMTARGEIGVRTIFNILGPMLNPANAKYQLIGVYDPDLTQTIVSVLKNLGSKRAMAVHGYPLDELSTCGKSKITQLNDDGSVNTYFVKPEDFGIKQAKLEELKGGSPDENAKIILDILNNKQGPKYDIAILNAAAAIFVSGKAKSIDEGILLAKKSIESGNALRCLKKLKEITNE